jgi:hypothetical protein
MADKEKLNLRRIIDQSALMQNIAVLKDAKFEKIDSGPFVNGISLDEEGGLENSGTIINKLYNFKEFIKAYNQLTPASLSTLVPYIQISKVYEDDTEFPIPFNNFYPKSAIDAITNTGSDRGHQANLVNLEFVSQGKDTATTFIYQVKINIIFDSIQTLFNEKSRYLELFNPPKKTGKLGRGDRDPKYYQIKLKFGWNFNKEIPSDLNPKQLQVFSEVSGSELFLSYVIHRITINEDGSVALQVEYIGALEAIARDSTKLTILSSKQLDELDGISRQITLIEERLQQNGYKPSQPEEKDGKFTVKIIDSDGNEKDSLSEKADLERLYEQQSSLETNNRKEFLNGIIKNIQEQYSGSFPVLKINETEYLNRRNLIKSFSSLNEAEKLKKIEEANSLISIQRNPNNVLFKENLIKDNKEAANFNVEKYLEELEKDPLAKQGEDSYYNTPFFTFGRLLKAIQSLGSRTEEGQQKKESDFIILCSDCNIASFGDGSFLDAKELSQNPEYKIFIDNGLVIGDNLVVLRNEIIPINITQIPIALSTFQYWINKNITSQNLTQMNLINFLNLSITDLLNLAVKSTNEDYVPAQNIKFKFFFDKVELNEDDLFLQTIRNNQGPSEIITKSTYGSIKDFFINKQIKSSKLIKKNIIIFYSMPSHNIRKNNFMKDLEDGIPHFFYGQNKGIINKITFREENMPFVREANIQTQVDKKPWKAGVFLRGKYNVVIDMLGTVNFRIGSMIYISPSFPGVINFGDPIEYGIGGYFVVISIKTSIESGKYITTLEANWVATGTGEFTDLSHLPFKVVKLSKPFGEINAQQQARTQQQKDEEEAEKIREETRSSAGAAGAGQ